MRKFALVFVFSLVFVAAILRLGGDTTASDPNAKATEIKEVSDIRRNKAPFARELKPTLPGEDYGKDSISLSSLTAKTLDKLHKKPSDVEIEKTDPHFTTAGLFDTSEEFGLITDTLRNDASKIPEGVEFYRICAEDSEILIAVRAVCLRNLKFWAAKARPTITVDIHRIPKPLHDIAAMLPKSAD